MYCCAVPDRHRPPLVCRCKTYRITDRSQSSEQNLDKRLADESRCPAGTPIERHPEPSHSAVPATATYSEDCPAVPFSVSSSCCSLQQQLVFCRLPFSTTSSAMTFPLWSTAYICTELGSRLSPS